MTRQMQRIEQLQARVEELKTIPDLRPELESKESKIKELNETITDRFVRITDLEKEVRKLEKEVAEKSIRISKLEFDLKKANDPDKRTFAERMKALTTKSQREKL
jgi:predicted  nucleic acid-binding Zn-ribbon protein